MSPAPVSVTDPSSGGMLASGGYEASPARSSGVGAEEGAERARSLVTRTSATTTTAATARERGERAKETTAASGRAGVAPSGPGRRRREGLGQRPMELDRVDVPIDQFPACR